MTTKVTIDAHAGWPVKVTPLSGYGGHVGAPSIVEPKTVREFAVFDGQDILIHEVQPREADPAGEEYMLQHFRFEHLRDDLKEVSRPFAMLAERLVALIPANPERTVALRKLLEAKDAAVRAMILGKVTR